MAESRSGLRLVFDAERGVLESPRVCSTCEQAAFHSNGVFCVEFLEFVNEQSAVDCSSYEEA